MRKPRELVNGAIYHVTMRANRKEMIFDPRVIRELYMEILNRAKRRYFFTIDNFIIMGNHVHLMIRPGKNENLSRIMQWINSVFAMKYNKIYGLTGHVWGERFFSVPLKSINKYLYTFDYINKNPVCVKLVDNMYNWLYSGSRFSLEGNYQVLAPPNTLINMFFPGWKVLCIT